MAGLFDTYRRHNKLIFGLIFASMVLFMVGTMFVSNNRGGGNQDPVVATWRYGTIRLSDVIRCQRQQNLINRFRAEAMMALVGQDQEVPPVTQTVALEQLLLTKRAESLGIVVSDARVLEAIKEMTFGVLPNEMTRKILAKIGLSEELLVQIARSNIMASRVRSMFFNTVRAEPPAEQWNAYLREHRKITAEVATLPVEDYVASVPSPTETQLHEFYEKNKDAVAHDGEPGFRLPYRAAFQYFVAQQPIFLAKAQAAVTDAEIQDYYDKHKADFKEPDLPQDPDKKDADKKDTDKKDADKKDADKKDADKKDTDKKDDAAGTEKKEAAPVKEPAKPSEAKTDDKKPPVPSADSAIKDADKKDADKKDADKKDAGQKDADKNDADKKDADKKDAAKTDADQKAGDKKADDKGSARLVRPAANRLVAFNLADADQPADEKKADEKSADDKKADDKKTEDKSAEEKKADDKNADDKKADEKKVDDKKADEKKADEKKADEKKADDKKADDKKADDKKADDKKPAGDVKLVDVPKPAKYKTLAEAKDEIRKLLALNAASKNAADALRAAIVDVDSYANLLGRWQITRIDHPDQAAPPVPNFSELAKQHDLKLRNTPLYSKEELIKNSDLAKVLILVDNRGNAIHFADKAYGTPMSEYQPQLAVDGDGNWYEIWLTESQKENLPKFEDAKAEVTRQWKLAEARKKVQAEAERLAGIANKDPKTSLKDSLAKETGVKVTEIGPFTWLTEKGLPPHTTTETSTIPGMDEPGDRFMQAVAKLDIDGIGAAWNQPQTDAYVVRVKAHEPSPTVLLANFSADVAPDKFQDQKMQLSIYRKWMEVVKDELGVHMEMQLDKKNADDSEPAAPGEED